tara:strand:- start:3423 stop:3578 length:156 start_codon:yes stop_codon:yes gene_type:complete
VQVELSEEDLKKIVMDVLIENDFEKRRSRTMDLDDFLKLLNLFNEKGLHFT